MTLDELVAQAQAVAAGAQTHSVGMAAYVPPPPLTAQLVADAEGLGSSAVMYAASLAAYRDSLIVQVPPPSATTWTRIDTGGGVSNSFFRKTIMLPAGDIWSAWKSNTGPSYQGSFIFRHATKIWGKTHTLGGWPYDVGQRENFGGAYDADRNCVWLGAASVGSHPGECKFDLATNLYSEVYVDPLGIAHSVLSYRANKLYSFGGWSVNSNQQLKRRDLTTGAETNINGAVAVPIMTDPARMSTRRGGTDSRDGKHWILADGYELYTHATESGDWTHVTTTGTKPSNLFGVAALDESKNAIVVRVGLDSASDQAAPIVNKTWALSLDSLAWSELSVTGALPVAKTMSKTNMLYDWTNQCVTLTVDNDTGTLVYELRGLL